MSTFQQTIIVGYLGRDPELRYTQTGDPVCNFSVAVTEKWSKDGQQHEKTTWFRVTAWRKLAEICAEYLSKGRLVLVEGRVDASAYTAQDGSPKASLDLTASNVRFLGTKDEGGNGKSRGDAPHVDEEEIPF